MYVHRGEKKKKKKKKKKISLNDYEPRNTVELESLLNERSIRRFYLNEIDVG